MLIQLTPEQIASNWDFLKKNIVEGGPLDLQGNDEKHLNILNALLLGDMQCWAEAVYSENNFHIQALLLTQVLNNEVVGIKNLLLYSLVGLEDVFDIEKWNRGFLTVTQFAKKHGCHNILAYSDNVRILRMAERLNADTSQRLIVFSLR